MIETKNEAIILKIEPYHKLSHTCTHTSARNEGPTTGPKLKVVVVLNVVRASEVQAVIYSESK